MLSAAFKKKFVVQSVDEASYSPSLLSAGKPLLIKTVHAKQPLLSPDIIHDFYADKLVNVGVFDRSKDRNFPQDRPLMLLKDALSLFYTNNSERFKYYMMEQEINDDFPLLLDQLQPLNSLFPDREIIFKLWFGEKDNVSPLHYDAMHNLLYQAYGSKEVLIFSPEDTPFLYPSVDLKRFNYTLIDNFELLDVSRFPLAVNARAAVVTLAQGDVLFLPSGWWHHATALDLSVTIPCWWKPRIQEAPASHIFRLKAWESFDKKCFEKLHNFLDLSSFRDSFEIACAFYQENNLWLTILFLCDFLACNPIDFAELGVLWSESVVLARSELEHKLDSKNVEKFLLYISSQKGRVLDINQIERV